MFPVNAVVREFRPVKIPVETGFDLIGYIGHIGVDGQGIARFFIGDRLHAFGLRPERIHDPYPFDTPDYRRFPVYRFGDSFQRFVSRYVIGTFFPAQMGDGVGKKGITPVNQKGNAVFCHNDLSIMQEIHFPGRFGCDARFVIIMRFEQVQDAGFFHAPDGIAQFLKGVRIKIDGIALGFFQQLSFRDWAAISLEGQRTQLRNDVLAFAVRNQNALCFGLDSGKLFCRYGKGR